jgi:hypothetical protein
VANREVGGAWLLGEWVEKEDNGGGGKHIGTLDIGGAGVVGDGIKSTGS